MELSHHFSATLYGLESGNHYYELASSRMCLVRPKAIAFSPQLIVFLQNKESAVLGIPLLCANAEDDPIVPVSCVPLEAIEKHPNVSYFPCEFIEFTS